MVQSSVNSMDTETMVEALKQMDATTRRVMGAVDLYAVLQLGHDDVTPEAVKKAYHRTSKVVHPDKNKSRLSDDAFKRVGEAFSTLSDPKRKQVYDLGLKATCNHCAGVTARGAMDAHLRACPRRPTTCAWAAAGCVWSGVPAEQAAHQAMCPIGFAVFQFQQMAQQVAAQNYLLQAQHQAQHQGQHQGQLQVQPEQSAHRRRSRRMLRTSSPFASQKTRGRATRCASGRPTGALRRSTSQ